MIAYKYCSNCLVQTATAWDMGQSRVILVLVECSVFGQPTSFGLFFLFLFDIRARISMKLVDLRTGQIIGSYKSIFRASITVFITSPTQHPDITLCVIFLAKKELTSQRSLFQRRSSSENLQEYMINTTVAKTCWQRSIDNSPRMPGTIINSFGNPGSSSLLL